MPGRLALTAVLLLALVLASYAVAAQSEGAEIDLRFPMPDQAVLDQNGKHLFFYADLIKNKTVAINFIFTTCTSSCTLSTAVFRQVQQRLGKQKVQLITISVDPVNDTPEKLLALSQKFKEYLFGALFLLFVILATIFVSNNSPVMPDIF